MSPVPTLSALSQILEIRQEKRSIAVYTAKFSNLAMQSGLGGNHAIKLFLKRLQKRYKAFTVLTLKQRRHSGDNLSTLISHIVTTLATRDAVLTMTFNQTCSLHQHTQRASKPYVQAQQQTCGPQLQGNQVRPTISGSGYHVSALVDLDQTCLKLSAHVRERH
jgi:hypothetical protein